VLTNKTLTAPIIATIINTGTLTLPTLTDTLVGRATTDVLTNKTLTSPVISGGSIDNASIGNTTASSGKFTTLNASGTLTAGNSGSSNIQLFLNSPDVTGNITSGAPVKYIVVQINGSGSNFALPLYAQNAF
jgi:hypothetical protein